MPHDGFDTQYRPTDQSLDVAKRIAEALGEEFDAESTKQAADDLHARYFREICEVNELAYEVGFSSGSSYRVQAFVPQGETTVYFDELFDHWLFTVTHLSTVAACKELDGEAYRILVESFRSALDCVHVGRSHNALRWEVLPVLTDHHDCLQLSHALSRAMIVFIICHEIAHVVLGHPRTTPSRENELAADEFAATMFQRVVAASAGAGSIFVHHKLAFAPLLLFRFLGLVESRREQLTDRPPGTNVHPLSSEREAAIAVKLSPDFTEGCLRTQNGFFSKLDEIRGLLDLPARTLPPNE